MILPYRGTYPAIHPTVFVAPGADVIGRVRLAKRSSVWFCSLDAVRNEPPKRIRCIAPCIDFLCSHATNPLLVQEFAEFGVRLTIHAHRARGIPTHDKYGVL
jgi:hypothetical protein